MVVDPRVCYTLEEFERKEVFGVESPGGHLGRGLNGILELNGVPF